MPATETYGNNNSNSNITTNQNSTQSTLQQETVAGKQPIELTENFYIHNSHNRKHNLKIQVQLNGSGILLRRESEEHDQITEQLIRLEDIVGSHCGSKLKRRARGSLSSCKRIDEEDEGIHHHSENAENCSKQEQQDISAYLYIYAYVRKDKPLCRLRTVRILRFRSFLTYADNLKSAERWRYAIKFNKHFEEEHPVMESKPLLILLNPKSGKGKGRVMFQTQMAPILKEAEVQYELVVTTHANYARELVKQRKDLAQKYCGIMVASGDGLLFEVLNGIMERPDWRVLTQNLPVGIVPCGSGNGLAKSIAHLYNEPYESKPIINATLTCVSGQSAAMDIVRVELQGNQTEMYSFLSVGWGLIADIDIESEKLRSIGAPRFTLWSIHRLMRLRTYKGKVSYLPWHEAESTTTNVTNKEQQSSTEEKRQYILRRFHDAQDDDNEDFADAMEDDKNIQDEFADTISNRTNIDSWHSAASRRTAYYSIAGQSLRSNRSTANSLFSKIEQANAEFNTRAPQSTLPPLDKALSPEWHTQEGEFVLVQAAYTTHLATDCLFAPDSKLNDGIIYLVIIRAGIARSQLLQFLLNMSSGTHLAEAPTSYIQVIPVTAFRIEPQDEEGILTVDGERVGYGAIQAEIFPGLIKVMVPNVLKD